MFRVRIDVDRERLVLLVDAADEAAVLAGLREDFLSKQICTYRVERDGGTSEVHVRWHKLAAIGTPIIEPA